MSVDDDFLTEFARAHGIRRIALYGSALREDFRPDSDIDLLVEFQPEHTPGLLHLAHMELELEDALGRHVELRTPKISAPTSATRSLLAPARFMQPDDQVRLRHLREAATKAIHYRRSLKTSRNCSPSSRPRRNPTDGAAPEPNRRHRGG